MRGKTFVVWLCALELALVGCHKRASDSPATAQAELDACELIKKDEIKEVQGSPVTDVKGSANTDKGFRTTQCFYTTEQTNRSVSFLVTQRDPRAPGKRGPKDYWKDTFGTYREQEKEQKGDKEKKESLRESREKGEEEEAAPPKRIKGIGDDAFWTGSPVGGALYVLKKDLFIRISVGGPDHEETKIDKSKALAAKALARL